MHASAPSGVARLAAAVLVLAVSLSGCGQAPRNPVSGRVEPLVMDEPAELALGLAQQQQVLAQFGAYADARLQAYVDGIGQRLAARSQRPRLAWTFTVLDCPEPNAFALPGGPVHVCRGLLAYLGPEAELAAVLAHEIGHVCARHGAHQMARAQATELSRTAFDRLGSALEGAGLAETGGRARRAAQRLATQVSAAFSREEELQADGLGTDYLDGSPWGAPAMGALLALLDDQERYAADQARALGLSSTWSAAAALPTPSSLPGRRQEPGAGAPAGGGPDAATAAEAATHPGSERRVTVLRQRLWLPPGPVLLDDAGGRQRYLHAIDGLAFGERHPHGVRQAGRYLHRGLGLAVELPPGWLVSAESDGLLMSEPGGDHGLSVQRAVAAPAGAAKPHEPGAAAPSASAEAQPPAALQRRLRQLQLPDGVTVTLRAVARSPAALQQAQAQLQALADSAVPLDAEGRRQAGPLSLRLRPLPLGGLPALAAGSPLPAPAEPLLRLLNGAYGGVPLPPVGQLVKVVELAEAEPSAGLPPGPKRPAPPLR